MNTKKGFTIIELLVVIAIIAVLAGIVLVNVASYIKKGKIAAIKADFNTILVNSAVWMDSHSDYTGFFPSSSFLNPSIHLSGLSMNLTGQSISMFVGPAPGPAYPNFCLCAFLDTIAAGAPQTKVYCVDSSGYKKEVASSSCICSMQTGLCNEALIN